MARREVRHRVTVAVSSGLLLIGLVLSDEARASCVSHRAVTSSTPGATSFIYTPGHPFTPAASYPDYPYGGSTTYYLLGSFWSFVQ